MTRDTIELSDIEFVTDKTLEDDHFNPEKNKKIFENATTEPGDLMYRNERKELFDLFLVEEFTKYYKDMGSLREVDWSKVRALDFNDLRIARRQAAGEISKCACLECPDFLEHVFIYNRNC